MADLSAPPLRVLVVGATGTFGSRLVAGLLAHTGFDVVAAGRSAARLSDVLARHRGAVSGDGRARLSSLVLDVHSASPDSLRRTGASAVVDAAGPYQGGCYGLARAAIAAGLHYVDLADARDWVAGFGAALDREAQRAGVVALSGASSTPALSNAALDRITAGWRRVDRVEVAISPGNRAPRGLSVVRSILSYAGRPVLALEGGQWRERPGWGMTTRRAVPSLGRRWLGLVDTPDLDIIPERYAEVRTALFRAGLELPVLHLGLLLATLPVRTGLLRSLLPVARPFRAAAALLEPFGTDRGGMLVEAEGLDGEGAPVRGRWWLVAEGGDGPCVPTLPALAVLRTLASGRLAPGARPCVGVLPLEAIEAEARPYRITSGLSAKTPGPSLYETVLGSRFQELPAPLRELHRSGWGRAFEGTARVDGAEGPLARMVARVLGLPRTAPSVPVRVEIAAEAGRERWTRSFGDSRFSSTLSAAGRSQHLIERFGPFRFELELQVAPEGVRGMPVRRWWLGPLPMPRALAPVSLASEAADGQGRFRFDVELRLPLGFGRLVRYQGWLVPEDAAPLPIGASLDEGAPTVAVEPRRASPEQNGQLRAPSGGFPAGVHREGSTATMTSAAVLDAIKARLAATGLSTRPWILLDRDGSVGIAFDDSDTLAKGGPPWKWEAVERVVKDELLRLGLFGVATSWAPDTGVVWIRWQRR